MSPTTPAFTSSFFFSQSGRGNPLLARFLDFCFISAQKKPRRGVETTGNAA